MRRLVISLLVFCGLLPAQTKKVIANLSPEMLKELAVSAPNVRIVSARGADLAKEIEDADAMVGVTLTPELFKRARQLKWLHISSAGVRTGGDHGLDILELQRAVLHLVPGIVVVFGRFAVGGDVELGLCVAEDLLAFEELLFDGVIKLRLLGQRGDG